MLKIDIMELNLEKGTAKVKASLPKRTMKKDPYYDYRAKHVCDEVYKQLKEQSSKILECSCLSAFTSLCNKYEKNVREILLDIRLKMQVEEKKSLVELLETKESVKKVNKRRRKTQASREARSLSTAPPPSFPSAVSGSV